MAKSLHLKIEQMTMLLRDLIEIQEKNNTELLKDIATRAADILYKDEKNTIQMEDNAVICATDAGFLDNFRFGVNLASVGIAFNETSSLNTKEFLPIQTVSNVSSAELLAVLRALQIAEANNIDNIVIITDSFNTIKKLKYDLPLIARTNFNPMATKHISEIDKQLLEAINNLQLKIKTRYRHVKSHQQDKQTSTVDDLDIYLNKVADGLASQGLQLAISDLKEREGKVCSDLNVSQTADEENVSAL